MHFYVENCVRDIPGLFWSAINEQAAKLMILYHFTTPANVLLISVEGLKPAAQNDNVHMTQGKPVVWLTTQSNNRLTAEDVAFLKMSQVYVDVGQYAYGGGARLAVQLELNNKRLKRYFDLLSPQARSAMLPSAREWFVYFGTIPSARIDTRLSAALMLECLDHHIETHPDLQARERFKVEREKVADFPPDEILDGFD